MSEATSQLLQWIKSDAGVDGTFFGETISEPQVTAIGNFCFTAVFS